MLIFPYGRYRWPTWAGYRVAGQAVTGDDRTISSIARSSGDRRSPLVDEGYLVGCEVRYAAVDEVRPRLRPARR
jgi:hypothetical protein